eukprot:gene11874-4981_t
MSYTDGDWRTALRRAGVAEAERSTHKPLLSRDEFREWVWGVLRDACEL